MSNFNGLLSKGKKVVRSPNGDPIPCWFFLEITKAFIPICMDKQIFHIWSDLICLNYLNPNLVTALYKAINTWYQWSISFINSFLRGKYFLEWKIKILSVCIVMWYFKQVISSWNTSPSKYYMAYNMIWQLSLGHLIRISKDIV